MWPDATPLLACSPWHRLAGCSKPSNCSSLMAWLKHTAASCHCMLLLTLQCCTSSTERINTIIILGLILQEETDLQSPGNGPGQQAQQHFARAILGKRCRVPGESLWWSLAQQKGLPLILCRTLHEGLACLLRVPTAATFTGVFLAKLQHGWRPG